MSQPSSTVHLAAGGDGAGVGIDPAPGRIVADNIEPAALYRVASNQPILTRVGSVADLKDEYRREVHRTGGFARLIASGRKNGKKRRTPRDQKLAVWDAHLYFVDEQLAAQTGRLISAPHVRQLQKETGLGRSCIKKMRDRLRKLGFLKLIELGGFAKGPESSDATVYELVVPGGKLGKKLADKLGKTPGSTPRADSPEPPGALNVAAPPSPCPAARPANPARLNPASARRPAHPDCLRLLGEIGYDEGAARAIASHPNCAPEQIRVAIARYEYALSRGTVKKGKLAYLRDAIVNRYQLPRSAKEKARESAADFAQSEKDSRAEWSKAQKAREARALDLVKRMSDERIEGFLGELAQQEGDSANGNLMRGLNAVELRTGKYPTIAYLVAARERAGGVRR